MADFGAWRNTIRNRVAAKLPGVHCYITATPISFFKVNEWVSPAVVLHFPRVPAVDTTSRLVGTGEQLMDVFFDAFVAVRGGKITTQDDVIQDNTLGTLERNEQMTNGVYDTINSLVSAMTYFEVDTNCRCISQGWEEYAEAPMTSIYVTRWRIGGLVIQGDGT